MPPYRGGGMTAAHTGSATTGDTPAMTSATPTHPTTPREHRSLCFSAAHSVRRTAPASRPSGRYAVGLRPSLDTDALHRRAQTTAKKQKERSQPPLDRPRSFRDDLQVCGVRPVDLRTQGYSVDRTIAGQRLARGVRLAAGPGSVGVLYPRAGRVVRSAEYPNAH